jgi:peroxiredoxin
MTREHTGLPGRLQIGDTAPIFQATDINGQAFDLAALRGSRIWLSFLRFANCPLAQAKLDKIKASSAAFPALRPIAIGTPGVATRLRYREAGFPVIADGDQTLYRLYGVEHSFPRAIVPTNQWAGFKALCHGYPLRVPLERPWWRMPADFLIDENGLIADAHYGRRMHDDIARQRVVAFIEPGLHRPGSTPEPDARRKIRVSPAD